MDVLLTEHQEQQLRELATNTQRSEQELAQEAIDRFLEYQEHFAAAVREGLDDLERGDLYTHEEVKERIRHRLAS